MDLIEFWHLIKKSRLLIGATTLLGLILSAIITFTTTPIYQAKAQLFVSTPASALDISALATGGSFTQQRVKSYAQIIANPLTLKPVIKDLKLDTTPDQLAKMITANAPLDTVLINLTVSNQDPKLAAEIANAVADQFAVTVGDLELKGLGVDAPVKVSTVVGAIPPTTPSSPKKSLNLLLGLILGFGMGFGLSMLRAIFDNSVKNEDHLDGTPLLAAIGFDETADEKPLITQIGRYAARTESYRTFRTNLQFINPDAHPQAIVITSSLPNEGKSTSAANIALSLAQAGAKTILVDTDLRRPKIPVYFGTSSMAYGVTELISGKRLLNMKSLKELIQKDEKTPLHILVSGHIPPNPSELLGSNKFDELIALLRKQYDYIILDCPPMLPVTDAAIVAAKADGAVLVVHAGVTLRPQFIGTRDAIASVGSTVIGVVLNKIPESSLEYEYGYRYGYPRYYGSKYRSYGSKSDVLNKYEPNKEVLNRFEIEERFEHIRGRKFKEELLRELKDKDL